MSFNPMGAAAHGGGSKRVRTWPPTRPPVPGEGVRATCTHCGLDWDVHQAMAGFRLRCECDAWVPVPHPLGAPARIAPAPALPISAAQVRAEARHKHQSERRRQRLSRQKPEKAKAAHGKRAKVINRGLIGTLFLTLLIAAPIAWVQTQYSDLSWAILWPAMGGFAAVLLGFAALFGRARYLVSMRSARLRHSAEGLGVGLLGGAILTSLVSEMPSDARPLEWIHGLIGELGIPMAAIALVLLPALGHALFFREVLARRLQVLLSPRSAGVLAALALAVSHGLGVFTPILAVLALHATWLRKRSHSSVPGLIEDLAIAGVVFGALIYA